MKMFGRSWIVVFFFALATSLAWPARADHLLLSIAPGGGTRPPDPVLKTIDPTDGSTITEANVTITLAGFTVIGGSGLARHPQTETLYALLKVSGSSFRRLVMLDETTGVATDIGDTVNRYAGMAFTADGTLYGITGDGGGNPESLFILSLVDASSTLVIDLGAGSDGETIAFNPTDRLIYHASGIGTPNHPNGEIFETVDPGMLGVANVPLSGFDYEELTSLTYSDGAFYAGDVGDSAVDMPSLYRITPAGVVTLVGAMDHVSKGLVEARDPEPPPVPVMSAAPALLLVALLAFAGIAAGKFSALSVDQG
jgi:hypothetical protein